jgi:succinate dehydrogenase / fumarate reductase cytochrome b subunit
MWNSSIGLKMIVAVTGAILALFVVGHMVGNLQVFLGPEVFNAYGEKLRAIPVLLWIVRAVVAASALLHVTVTIMLALGNNAARPVGYDKKQSVRASLASRTMVWGGLLLAAFVFYHLAHYTWRLTNPEYQSLLDAHGRPDIYAMVVAGFKNALISISYIIAMILLGFHLSHGIASMFQTVGWATTKTLPRFERAAVVIAIVLVLGYISIPISILTGLVR